MKRPRLRPAASLIAIAIGTAAASETPAQVPGPLRASLVNIEQIGDGNHSDITQIGGSLANNRAGVYIRGDGNGTGVIAGRTVTGMITCGNSRCRNLPGVANGIGGHDHDDDGAEDHTKYQGVGRGHSAPAADFVMPALASGVIYQEGEDNIAVAAMVGDQNDFHIAQIGDDNSAVQVAVGNGNSAAITQGTAALPGRNNLAVQIQAGSGNTAYAAQNGSNNVAKQLQLGPVGVLGASALLASSATSPESLIAAASGFGGASGNVSLLEQNGDGNTALLAQVGSSNLIALRQQGYSNATITQVGTGLDIRVEQVPGVAGSVSSIAINQTGR